MKDKIFGVLQRVGRSFMLPIAILPVAGILLGIGSSFSNTTTIETYGLTAILGEGTILHSLMLIFNAVGSAVFNNLAVLFAIGVAVGMAKREKEVAALAAVIAYFVMNTAINAMLTLDGQILADGSIAPDVLDGTITSSVGIMTLQMGVFGGIIVGLGVAALHNRFYKIELPTAISFFGGTRFVPIISTLVYMFVGILMFFVWPVVQHGINALGVLVQGSGVFGTLIFGLIKRALIPFGLHHVFYMPFWQTEVGGAMEVAGQMYYGGQNIFFAQLAHANEIAHFSADATRYFSGEFIFMIFGLPGAALAMYQTAKPEKKKEAGGLLLGAALASMLTGITEPIEFSFLFVAPVLFGVQVILAGSCYMLAHLLNIAVGLTFSGGLLDLFFFGILQGNAKTSWLLILPCGAVYFFLYYIIFRTLILKFDYKTPGREEGDGETKLYSKADYQAKSGSGAPASGSGGFKDPTSAMILRGLGGKANLSDVDCCATRLRVTVIDPAKVNDGVLKSTGAAGVVHKGTGVQVIYGPQVAVIKSNLEDFLDTPEADTVMDSADLGGGAAPAEDKKPASKLKDSVLGAHMNGTVVPMEKVEDEAFSQCILGQGVAIEPSEGYLYSPVDGVVEQVFDTKHAIGIIADDGADVLLHIGIDTVKLNGKYFTTRVAQDQRVKKGDLLISFDMDAIKKAGYKVTTPMIIANTDEYSAVKPLASGGETTVGTDLLEVKG